MAETWKDCVGFEGYYEISDLGNARRIGKTKNLKNVINKDGYIAFCFSIKNKTYNVLAHKLVLEAHIGPCPIGEISRHKDGNRLNNQLKNLVYGTPKQNSEDMVRHGTQCKGSQSHLSILTEADVAIIKLRQVRASALADQFGVSRDTIYDIWGGRTWKHV